MKKEKKGEHTERSFWLKWLGRTLIWVMRGNKTCKDLGRNLPSGGNDTCQGSEIGLSLCLQNPERIWESQHDRKLEKWVIGRGWITGIVNHLCLSGPLSTSSGWSGSHFPLLWNEESENCLLDCLRRFSVLVRWWFLEKYLRFSKKCTYYLLLLCVCTFPLT